MTEPAPVWCERTELLLGTETYEKLRHAHVLVVGLGGVGAYAAEMIARAGVERMTIVDADVVSPSNINRQLVALHSTVGQPKADVLAARLRDINPAIELTVIAEYIRDEATDRLLDHEPSYSFVVDAIDTLAPKLALIKYCLDNRIPVVSSMGAGAKYDVTKIRIADISKSFNCPLAFVVRKRLRRMGITKGVKVVFSEELPDKAAFVPCDEKNKKSNAGTISYLPAVFGCACAQAVITGLLQNVANVAKP